MMPNFTIVAVMLTGECTPEGRTRSIQAYTEFKNMHTLGQVGGSQMTFTDSDGYIVFCFVLLVGDGYAKDFYVNSWEKVCGQFGLFPGDSYENVLNYYDAVHGYYYTLGDNE